MRLLLSGITCLLTLGLLAGPAAATEDYTGTTRNRDCSGAVVRWPSSVGTDDAVVLTNGHCYRIFRDPRTVALDRPSDQRFALLGSDGSVLTRARADRLIYATMYRTDVGLYHLPVSYASLAADHGVVPLTLKASLAKRQGTVTIPSGYWRETYTCQMKGYAFKLREQIWRWRDSLRYLGPDCRTKGGTSGSPVLNAHRRVIGVNNTGYVGGRPCRDTVCEVSPDGTRQVYRWRSYGQQTWWITTCLDQQRQVDVTLPGCRLPAPEAS